LEDVVSLILDKTKGNVLFKPVEGEQETLKVGRDNIMLLDNS